MNLPNGTAMVSSPCTSIPQPPSNLAPGIWNTGNTQAMMVASTTSSGLVSTQMLDASSSGVMTFPTNQTMLINSVAGSTHPYVPTDTTAVTSTDSLQILPHLSVSGTGPAVGTLLMSGAGGNSMVVSCPSTSIARQIPIIQGPIGPVALTTNMSLPTPSIMSGTTAPTYVPATEASSTTTLLCNPSKPVESSSDTFQTAQLTTMPINPNYSSLLPKFTVSSDQSFVSSSQGAFSSTPLNSPGVGCPVPGTMVNVTKQPVPFVGDSVIYSSTLHGGQLAPNQVPRTTVEQLNTSVTSSASRSSTSSDCVITDDRFTGSVPTTSTTIVLSSDTFQPQTSQNNETREQALSIQANEFNSRQPVAEISLPPYKAEPLSQILAELDPRLQLDNEAEQLLTNLTNEFIIEIVQKSGKLAKHRDSPTVDAKDIQFCLERDWNVYVPSVTPDCRVARDTLQLQAHKQRMAIVKKIIKKM